jgi:hypothetical protein
VEPGPPEPGTEDDEAPLEDGAAAGALAELRPERVLTAAAEAE